MQTTRRLLLAGFQLLCVAMIAAAAPPSGPSLSIQSITGRVSFDYDSILGVEIQQEIVVKHKGDATEFFITLSQGSAPSFTPRLIESRDADTLEYQLYDQTVSYVIKDLTASPGLDEVLSGSFGLSSGWQTASVFYVLKLAPDQFQPAGTYDDSVTATLYSGVPDGVYVEKATKPVTFSGGLAAVLELSVVSPGSPFDPNSLSQTFAFGELQQSDSRSADIMVRSNSTYSVSLQSAGKGVMTHIDRQVSSTVPYTLHFDGLLIGLGGNQPTEVVTSAPPTSPSGWPYRTIVTIGDVGFPSAGDYEDVITISLSAP